MRLVRVAAAVAAGVAVLSGCSDGETANETLPATSTTAAESSASLPPLGPPDLPMPDEARSESAGGAEAFLRYYIDLLNHSTGNLDTYPLRDLTTNCQTCLAFADGLDGVADENQAIEGAKFVINGVSDARLEAGAAEFSVSL